MRLFYNKIVATMCQTIGHYCRTPASMLTTLRLTSATILYYYIFTLNKYRLALFKARWDLHQKKQVGFRSSWKIAIGGSWSLVY